MNSMQIRVTCLTTSRLTSRGSVWSNEQEEKINVSHKEQDLESMLLHYESSTLICAIGFPHANLSTF